MFINTYIKTLANIELLLLLLMHLVMCSLKFIQEKCPASKDDITALKENVGFIPKFR
jgi:hypothetical protein